jgi:N-acetylmuramoyl-L-alanine amidase
MLKSIVVWGLLLYCTGCVHRDNHESAKDTVGKNVLLTEAASALDSISRYSHDAIPDSALNAAKCVITVPLVSRVTGEINARGVASCRNGSDWRAPIPLAFSGWLGQRTPAVLVVLVMTDRAESALQAGEITIQKPQRKAPLVSTAPLITQFDLASDFLTYEALDSGMLVPSLAAGSFRAEQDSLGPPVTQNGSAAKSESDPVAKYAVSLRSLLNTIVPTGIVIHHTALIGSSRLPTGVRDVDEYHQQRGFEIYCFGQIYHMAYHYLILPDGTVQHGRPERCEGAHARGYNSYLGISIIGDFSSHDNPTGKKGTERPTLKQLQAIVELCRMLRHKYKIPLQHVVRHSDIASTDCPGDRFPFNQILSGLDAGGNGPKVSQQ